MLNQPPCISPLVGCDSTDVGGASSSNTNLVAVASSSSSSSSSRASYWSVFDNAGSSSSSSSSGFSSSSSSSLSSGYVTLLSSSTRTAQYTVTVRNRGQTALQSVIISHGPTPSGAMFLSAQSSSECQAMGTEVQCVMNLGPGESKNFTLTYQVNNSTSCALARLLQNIQSPSTEIQTSVTCVMKNGTLSSVSSSTSSLAPAISSMSSSSSSAMYDPYAVTNSGAYTYIDPSAATLNGQGQNVDTGKGKGFKPYPKPRTGAFSDIFANPKTASMLSPVGHRTENSAIYLRSSGVFLALLGVALGALIFFVLLRRKWVAEHAM